MLEDDALKLNGHAPRNPTPTTYDGILVNQIDAPLFSRKHRGLRDETPFPAAQGLNVITAVRGSFESTKDVLAGREAAIVLKEKAMA
ncbi:hypothetical protein KM043_011912 [Ampulex compressa]|nr:hypothetical protein KM043_011912 [Ampulex compressa]